MRNLFFTLAVLASASFANAKVVTVKLPDAAVEFVSTGSAKQFDKATVDIACFREPTFTEKLNPMSNELQPCKKVSFLNLTTGDTVSQDRFDTSIVDKNTFGLPALSLSFEDSNNANICVKVLLHYTISSGHKNVVNGATFCSAKPSNPTANDFPLSKYTNVLSKTIKVKANK